MNELETAPIQTVSIREMPRDEGLEEAGRELCDLLDRLAARGIYLRSPGNIHLARE